MDAPHWLPDHLNACAVSDDAFAEAYEEAGAAVRAGIKSCLAALFALHPPRRSFSRSWSVDTDSGLRLSLRESALDAAVVLLGPAPADASKILAAIHPAAAAGVADIAVVRVGENPTEWPAAVLAALELAGQELVFDCSRAQSVQLLEALSRASASAALVDLGLHSGLAPVCAALDFDFSGRRVWTAPAGLGDDDLRLGEGCESCWAWPSLSPEFFMSRRLAFESADDETSAAPTEFA
ncbi:MAG: histidinol dehydrogenase [Desulfovibrionaceae bacterium]